MKVLITEQGVADLRGKDPRQRAEAIIENCAHPAYKQLLWDYLKLANKSGLAHTPHHLHAAFALHESFIDCGDMSQVDFGKYY